VPHEPRLKVLIHRRDIRKRVGEIARRIEHDYRGRPVHLVGVLKGACIFLSDLVRQLDLDVSVDFMSVASYGKSSNSSGQVKLIKDLDSTIEGMDVILVEDILDTGLTLDYLRRILIQRKPRTLRIATLLDKPARRMVRGLHANYVGFRIPNEFVVGYGLDYAERYRNLQDICVLVPPPALNEHGHPQP
jgi:hypoxanthine phosphoribosyltransferase